MSVRDQAPEVPIIVLTGFDDVAVANMAIGKVRRTVISTGINCAFCIGGTKLIQPTNKDSAPCAHYGFRDFEKAQVVAV